LTELIQHRQQGFGHRTLAVLIETITRPDLFDAAIQIVDEPGFDLPSYGRFISVFSGRESGS
jgi:hypothetical protein